MTTQRTITFILNGHPASAQVGNHQNLVEVLQGQGLCGARESCAQGLCGCCTVIVDGKAVSGCLTLAPLIDGADVRTIEEPQAGSKDEHGLDAVQQAFIETGAFQCGFCTPGFVLMTRQLLDAHANPSEDEIRHYLAGNLCRCATYPEVVKAVRLAASKRKKAGKG
ncbi:MAG: (2Fe-2S)-binding protein [Burkholderiales bacterium]|nr:(2Fe-2S)-binding protein [Burkholderiales bacterium]